MSSESTPYDPTRTTDWLVCNACGTQFPTSERSKLATCFICDDPRQFTPPSGQSFTTLTSLRSTHKNTFTPLASDPENIISIATTPKFAIGQRAIFIRTSKGNVLWDCITLLDSDTITKIKSLGGLSGIIISHPHYYTTHLEWASAFSCPVYLASEDSPWLAQRSPSQIFINGTATPILGTTVLKLGGHFPGSLVLLSNKRLFIADTLVTTPSGLGSWDKDAMGARRERPQGMNTFVFMWSIPNMIPLAPDELARMWRVLKEYEFSSTHGAFLGVDIEKSVPEMKRRVLESIQIQVRASGHGAHELLSETVE
ncbi:beta-lactamase-like protein [Xylariaceae sp. FL1272]|nr:beta-lactamase-like protein [Xylariaceae sp. FL1272]